MASKFLLGTINQKGQRRLMIDGNPNIITGMIFSSWIISASFDDWQFEILCLPNDYTLQTEWKRFDEITAGFGLYRS